MKEFIGVCAHCGQVVVTELDFASQAEADVWASENCSCPDAEIERQKRERIQAAERQVETLFARGCEKYGFKPVENGVVVMLTQLVRIVANGDADRLSVVLPFGSGGKFTAALTSKGKVKVTRSVGNALALEA